MEIPASISCSRDAFSILKLHFNPEAEEFYAIALGPELKILETKMIFKGTVDQVWIHPRDVFRFALQRNASGIIVAHNHPSRSVRPSEQDISQTKKLIQCGKILQIPVYDHVVFSETDYFSFKDQGTLKF